MYVYVSHIIFRKDYRYIPNCLVILCSKKDQELTNMSLN